jgi:hypothetical protein
MQAISPQRSQILLAYMNRALAKEMSGLATFQEKDFRLAGDMGITVARRTGSGAVTDLCQ